jgi:Anti-sigma-K factor rskA, C-terminal
MLSESDIEGAHPEAFDFVWGNLPAAKRTGFNRHLSSCRHCRAVVDEYAEIGQIIKLLPPHVEPPADLEERTIARMVAALAEQRAEPDHPADAEDRTATRVYPIPRPQPPAETQVQPEPQSGPGPPAETAVRPMVTRLPVWRRYRSRLAAVVAVAAAIITAAIVVPLSLGGGRITPAQASAVIPLHATAAAERSGDGAATGRAVARQDASGSWDITLTVAHLRHFDQEPWYECWYVSRNGQVISAGTFLVGPSGSRTFTMTSAADPHDFPKMEITLQSPDSNGAVGSTVILSGTPL